MNPVSSYNDFIKFLRYSNNNHNKLIPVFLIKPSTILYFNREHSIDQIFDYFDRRSGDNVQFFLPGYAHYPDIAFHHIWAEVPPYNDNYVALNTGRLGKIYYSNNDFIEFIETLEKESPNFMYRGNPELLFIKYIPDTPYACGRFSFSNIYRYDLSKLFYLNRTLELSEYERLEQVARFLESVIIAIRRSGNNDDQLIAYINTHYNIR